jgi:NTE family protein
MARRVLFWRPDRKKNLHNFRGASANGTSSYAPELRGKLKALPILAALDDRSLNALIAKLQWLGVPGGGHLFRKGDLDTSMYIVISGRLGVYLHNEDGEEVLARQMAAGETVGELGLLSGEPRSATVVALRDTELVRLSKDTFDLLIEEHPKTLRFITDLLVRRLQRPPRLRPSVEAPKTVALIPLYKGKADDFAHRLAKVLEQLRGRVFLVDDTHSSRTIEWFNALEESHGYVIYQADFEPTAWTQLCLRQADCVLVIADEARDLIINETLNHVLNKRADALELVILHDLLPEQWTGTGALLERVKPKLHHHVRRGNERDYRRLGRMISRQAIGMVLSGGGARGLTHVGVLRALHEAGIEIDLLGGASMGSIVGAAAAVGWDSQELSDHMRAAFTIENPVSDYTLPMIALARGRKTSRFLREHFGERQIEDSLYSYFCVSANLSTRRMKIHRSGPIWRATRASVSIPGVLSPVVDGSDLLVDGGLLNNLPVDVMSDMRRGPIMAVDVSSDSSLRSTIDEIEHRPFWQLFPHARKGTPNIVSILMAAGSIGSEMQLRDMRGLVDLLIEPPLSHIGMLHWKQFDAIVETGYRATISALEDRREHLDSCGIRFEVPS